MRAARQGESSNTPRAPFRESFGARGGELTLGSDGTIRDTTVTLGTSSDSFTGTWTTDSSGTIVGTEITIGPGLGSGSTGTQAAVSGDAPQSLIGGGLGAAPLAEVRITSDTDDEVTL